VSSPADAVLWETVEFQTSESAQLSFSAANVGVATAFGDWNEGQGALGQLSLNLVSSSPPSSPRSRSSARSTLAADG
jgi:hypothetical protein